MSEKGSEASRRYDVVGGLALNKKLNKVGRLAKTREAKEDDTLRIKFFKAISSGCRGRYFEGFEI